MTNSCLRRNGKGRLVWEATIRLRLILGSRAAAPCAFSVLHVSITSTVGENQVRYYVFNIMAIGSRFVLALKRVRYMYWETNRSSQVIIIVKALILHVLLPYRSLILRHRSSRTCHHECTWTCSTHERPCWCCRGMWACR